jgi:phosphate transport system permease protein
MNQHTADPQALPARDAPQTLRRQARRLLIDRLVHWLMATGGVLVILAVLLIFVYLLYVVLPIFAPARIEQHAVFDGITAADARAVAVDEYGSHAVIIDGQARARTVSLADGVSASLALELPEGVSVSAVSAASAPGNAVAIGLTDGRAVVVGLRFGVSYEGSQRRITPAVTYPLGKEPIVVDEAGRHIEALVVQGEGDIWLLAADVVGGQGVLASIERSESLLDESVEISIQRGAFALPDHAAPRLWLDPQQQNLFSLLDERTLLHLDVRRPEAPLPLGQVGLVAPAARVTALEMLAGGISLLVGDDRGRVTQWFAVRDDANVPRLTAIRHFNVGGQVAAIAPEPARKGFAVLGVDGGRATVHLLHSTSGRDLLDVTLNPGEHPFLAFSARADTLLAGSAKGIEVLRVDNPHPEISFRSLWQPVWYESREAPEYIWQSSSASDDFEPKFSLMPLTFGTLKGAFYAMLLAVPLAIMGAIYTGYFMSVPMRRTVKPVIELMAALPTVILGFLAGLWLAPLMEQNLPGVLSLAVLLPLAVLVAAWLWSRLPEGVSARLPDSVEVLILIPVICLTVALALGISPWLEATFFGGDMPGWLTRELGLGFDQRNSLVVGIAMGFAIIPNIFSIAEDAVFGVPKHLTVGSLALGATPWQTLTRVVLLTASPGIFSAVMIGFGRAVGETMIVLMATGNTPVMDLNLFQGFRALSANVAVEMPESAVDSTHFRVLFLAALVLFVITFLFNTVAELVRNRLRARYSSL